jgi:hypothetical protein
METDRKWIVIRIDGKLAGISRDYDRLAEISARIAEEYRLRDASQKKRKILRPSRRRFVVFVISVPR